MPFLLYLLLLGTAALSAGRPAPATAEAPFATLTESVVSATSLGEARYEALVASAEEAEEDEEPDEDPSSSSCVTTSRIGIARDATALAASEPRILHFAGALRSRAPPRGMGPA